MHTICALHEVSRHRTSEGLVSYHRCRCGRLEVRRQDVTILSSAGDTQPAPPVPGRTPVTPAGGRAGGTRIAAALGDRVVAPLVLVLMLVAATAVPPAALVVEVGLGLFVGGLAGVGAGFVAADPGRGVAVAVRTAAVAIPVVVVSSGLVAALGPVSVIALPAIYTVAGLAWWATRSGAGDTRAAARTPSRGSRRATRA
ncbi:hypothetical protein [Pseudonocardia sp. C8]|uniref:hypothetical protein n=1 Tax=Pseudonocardia sp. C8 TaxID=2762759 RepID=UPI001C93040F|nr:hypothetical protein [Pseudonocardia sp. C8]